VESEPGRGTAFVVRVPLSTGEPSSPGAGARQPRAVLGR